MSMSEGAEAGAQPSAEMHRSLRIPEIIWHICSHLNPIPRAGAADLATLARTCRIFHDPALDALWWEQDTIMNLMRCMPDVWETMTPPPGFLTLFLNGVGRPVTAARPIVVLDWDRVKKYSHRVKSLKCLDNDGLALSCVFEAIQLGAPDGCLLPNLRHFTWSRSNKRLLPFIDLFLGPNLTIFAIGSVEHNAHYSVLANVAHRYPALFGVYIGHLDPDYEDQSDDEDHDGGSADKEGSEPRPTDRDLSTFVCALTEPQFVDVGTLDLAALTHLGGLTTLRILTTTLPASISFPSARNGTLFSCLQIAKLHVERGDILGMTELVRTWNCPPLQSLEIQFETKSYDRFTSSIGLQSFQEFHDTVSTHCAPASLKIFKLDATDDDDSSASAFVYPGHLLRSLICFSNLIVVSIRVLNGYELDDEVVSDLAHAWPHLRELRLGTMAYNHHPRTTLLSLQALAQHCLHLHTLEMTFDATTVPAAATTPQARIIQNNLVVLDPAFSHISDIFPVARYLSGMFTNLKKMEWRHSWSGDRRAWNEVLALVTQLHEIRKEEVMRGQSLIAQTSACAATATDS
ncbi:hypothetical protein DFH07DRAFT_1060303 [Mycena maculata]|uniref:F-box domain-containing protein n=1 Tax=Mycena maculata TaxID=230809 RepID=A0AAD7J8C1_9AGAR|nr:hypothetical protein DFH07DRAFT_1060303 [Mycena maculata]